jgi:alkanesulfonate monooxygenase SsuD/methylene tetrahydromethanopterin reductase-like flavin-dependent oxidoreductase (luciferase family)
MKLGICLRDEPVASLVRSAQFTEELGLTHLFLPEEIRATPPDGMLAGRNPWVSLGAVFQATEHLTCGVGVACLPHWSMPHLALAAATLQELSSGRFVLGVGVGHRETLSGVGIDYPEHPLAYTRERLHRLKGLTAAFGTEVPIGPRMTSVGAQHADGVVLNWLSPDGARSAVDACRADAQDRAVQTILYVRIGPAEIIAADVKSYSTRLSYRRHFATQNLDGPADITAATCLPWNAPAAALERLAEYEEAGIDVICIYTRGLAPTVRETAMSFLRGHGFT